MVANKGIVSSSRAWRMFQYPRFSTSLATVSSATSIHALAFSQCHKQILFASENRYHEAGGTPRLPLSDAYDYLIKKYQHCRSVFEAKRFHLDAIRSGFADDLFVSNTLINEYVRNGEVLSAQKVFDEMPERNSVTWACLISGYAQNGMPSDAFAAFGRMVAAGFVPNHYALGSALRVCQRMGNEEGLRYGVQIHGLVCKTCYSFDVVVCNVLISMYGSCIVGSVAGDYAWRVFDGIGDRNSISWNSIISVFCRIGDVDSAFSCFTDMQKDGSGCGFRPTEYTFASLVSAAAESFCVAPGSLLLEQLLAKVEKSGFRQDLYVGSALVSGFTKIGMVDTSKMVFQLMCSRNAVSVNGLMAGLVKLRRGDEALEVFWEMRDLVGLNVDSYVILLSAFGELLRRGEGKGKGKEVHGYLIRTGMIDSNLTIGNSLINMYAKCGAVEDACSLFNSMANKDSVSWSSMISGLDQNDRFEEAVWTFRAMKRNGLVPSNFTLISTLSSCSSLGWIKMGEQIHSEATKLGLSWDVSVSNTLLSMYADAGRVTECRKVFSFMDDRDQVSWNSIIRAFSYSEESIVEASKSFIEMMRYGWDPNSVTFINILAAASLSCAELTRQIHGLVLKYCLADDNIVNNSLLTCYGKCGGIDDCEKIFYRMTDRDDVSWNSMISGYIHTDRLSEAMDLVWLMLQNGQRLDGYTFATVLSACASVATLEHGMEVHACAIRACLVSDVVIGSALIDMYAKCGRIDYASRFFKLMPTRNVYSWNSMISGYARHGNGHRALEVFTQMKQENQVPDHVTFVGVLSACSHVGLVNQGYQHFESMSKVYSLTPQIEHYSCMVDLLGRAGKFDKLEDFIHRMPMKPNVLIWRTVLSVCGRANGRLLDLGRTAAHMIMELEPQNGVNHVLLANMYASGEKWEHMAEARERMRAAAARKDAGCSWVTMRDGIQVFVSGDKSHPKMEAIYDKLSELHWRMKEAGYVPQTNYSLYDLESENKEELLMHHSERLAVAFVLTMNESELPIRIMKNLRVCGDCHSAFKYISEIVRRQIVLRDSSRFHHFRDGRCSCNDYW